MSVINDLIEKIDLLEKQIKDLETKLKTSNANLQNLYSKINKDNTRVYSPSVTKSLDANNIWVGEKGENSYDNHAKLDVYYDEEADLWKTSGGWKLIVDKTVELSVDDFTPTYPDDMGRTVSEYYYIPKGTEIKRYLLIGEVDAYSWHYSSGESYVTYVFASFTGGYSNHSTHPIFPGQLTFFIDNVLKVYRRVWNSEEEVYEYPLQQYDTVNMRYKLYESVESYGEYTIV